jgi:hypothetical protein
MTKFFQSISTAFASRTLALGLALVVGGQMSVSFAQNYFGAGGERSSEAYSTSSEQGFSCFVAGGVKDGEACYGVAVSNTPYDSPRLIGSQAVDDCYKKGCPNCQPTASCSNLY